MASILDAIAENGRSPVPEVAPPAPPAAAETGRLTTANYIVTLYQLGNLIESAAGKFRQLPNAAPRDVAEILSEIGRTAAGIEAKAARLLAANR